MPAYFLIAHIVDIYRNYPIECYFQYLKNKNADWDKLSALVDISLHFRSQNNLEKSFQVLDLALPVFDYLHQNHIADTKNSYSGSHSSKRFLKFIAALKEAAEVNNTYRHYLEKEL